MLIYKKYKKNIKGDAQTLLQTVWLNNGVYFGMRGRQDHTKLVWGDIELMRFLDNREYLNKLGQIMKELTEKGNLEGRKINHSTRKTLAKTLVQTGHPPTEIVHLGGWKSPQTINAYSTPTLE